MDKEMNGLINSAFHAIGLLGLVLFIVLLYGRGDSLVHSWPRWRTMSLKAGLALVAGGHLLAALSFQSVPVGELMLNGGLAILWCWAAVFHYQHFLKRDSQESGEQE